MNGNTDSTERGFQYDLGNKVAELQKWFRSRCLPSIDEAPSPIPSNERVT